MARKSSKVGTETGRAIGTFGPSGNYTSISSSSVNVFVNGTSMTSSYVTLTPFQQPTHWLTGEVLEEKKIDDPSVFTTDVYSYNNILLSLIFSRLYEGNAPISLRQRTEADILALRLNGSYAMCVDDVIVHREIRQFYDPESQVVWWSW